MADVNVGVNAVTGARLEGWDHVVQSIADVLLTRFGSRIMREGYGSMLPDALGRNITRREILPVLASITSGISQWEPRFAVHATRLDGTDARSGVLSIHLIGEYRPRALLGDLTPEGQRTLIVGVNGNDLIVG